jgi:hypothetical protein
MFDTRPSATSSQRMTTLVYELLDAHQDTSRMVAELELDERWRAHLAYLSDLQRVGREMLAHTAARD